MGCDAAITSLSKVGRDMISLKYRASLYNIEKVDNGRGGWKENIVPYPDMWVSQYRITTYQELKFRQLDLKADCKFIARYNEDIDKNFLLVVNGKKYRVETVSLPVDRTDFMEIYAVGEK